MLMLAMTAWRLHDEAPGLTAPILDADLPRAIRLGRELLHRAGADARGQAALGQLLGRCLLASGHEVDAEELFGTLSRHYTGISRAHVRWLCGLDQGAMAMQLNRPTRAAQAFSAVADDGAAEPALRVEAMCGAAQAWHLVGECKRAWQSLDAALRIARRHGLADMAALAEAMKLDMAVLRQLRAFDALEDHALRPVYLQGLAALPPLSTLAQALADAQSAVPCSGALVARRLAFVAAAAAPGRVPLPVGEWLHWLRERRFSGLEPGARIEALLMLVAHQAFDAAAGLAGNDDEPAMHGHRHALDQHYVLAKLCQRRGRAGDALRHFARHAAEAVLAVHDHGQRKCATGWIDDEDRMTPSPQEPECVRLPLRYRRAYQYILENLQDEGLTVQRVAAHLGVTERALQMAFRQHLGFTPAEFIRTRRIERVHEALTSQPGEADLATLAQRHGIRNRATLSSNYRARFQCAPSDTLRSQSTAASL